MQQPSHTIELPQFTRVSTFALRLAQAYTSWRAPRSGEDIFTYFARRPTGDELGLRATLIREHILPVFNYTPSQIEFESQERFDLTLWSQSKHERRRIAIIETKSSAARNLAITTRGSETPVEQLERYLTQAGIYLGVLTNGDEWHLFDFALGREPLASFSLLELATLFKNVSSSDTVEQRLAQQPHMQQALAITYYYLDARRWEQSDIFRQHLANNAYHRIASLREPEHVETLVRQVKQILGSLRDTIHAQFALLQERYNDYQRQWAYTSVQDKRPFTETLQAALDKMGQFDATLRFLDIDGQLRAAIIGLLSELIAQYLTDGDISAFESEYLQKASKLLSERQINQVSIGGKKSVRSSHVKPPTEGLSNLKVLLQNRYAYIQALDEEYVLSKRTIEAYQAWKANVRGVFGNPQDEFCLQTAYVHFVRLFFVRVCEDHGLIPRRISDGPFARYEEYRVELLSGIKDTYLRLLEETYQRARTVYHNFFGRHELYDWFILDEYTILALFDLLNRYDFQGLNADVLGRVYNEGYIENKERSEKGQFYTPPQVVDYMLDALGIPALEESDDAKTRGFLEKSVGDLSCGSGTFLVAAASRKKATLQRLVANHDVGPDYAVQVLTETFLGFDLNPFACYLAEINMLIQCLPFLLDERGQLRISVDRFHIYCTDTLEPTLAEQARAVFFGKATRRLKYYPDQAGHVRSDEEQQIMSIKDVKGLPIELTQLHLEDQGIDYLIGNPPYVSAGEGSNNLLYRNEVGSFGIYHLLYQRWDLFVPFFERNLQFLRPKTGRLALIVSRGIESEGYAERLRQFLCSQYSLLQIDFFPGLRLFQDAAIENTIVVLENCSPDKEHQVMRRKHLQADSKHFETLPSVVQLDSCELVFRYRYDANLEESLAEGTIPLCAIVYIGTGIEAQSKETFDPVIDGERQKLFTLDDVFLLPSNGAVRPAGYVDDGVLGNDVDYFHLRRKRYVAYEKYRSKMRRPRHIALFRTSEKLLLGETSGGYYDREGLFANHSVQVVVRWESLKQSRAIEETGIKTVLHESQQLAGIDDPAPISVLFDLRYLLGVINSRFIRNYIATNKFKGTRDGRVYPDTWKKLPIKVTSDERQQQVAVKVDEIQALYQQLATRPTPMSLAANPTIHYRDIQGYIAQGILRFVGGAQTAIGGRLTIQDKQLMLRRHPQVYLESSESELLQYLELYLTQLQPKFQGWTWAEARRLIQIPATLEAVRDFMTSVNNRNKEEQRIRTIINTILTEIETMIETIYKEPADISKMEFIKSSQIDNGSVNISLF